MRATEACRRPAVPSSPPTVDGGSAPSGRGRGRGSRPDELEPGEARSQKQIQAHRDPAQRVEGPERVPYKARITPTPYMKARARPTARPPGESAASRASQVVRPVGIGPSPNQRALE